MTLRLERFSNTLLHTSQTYCHNRLLKPPLCHFKGFFFFPLLSLVMLAVNRGLFLNNVWSGLKSRSSAGGENDKGALRASLQPVWVHACLTSFQSLLNRNIIPKEAEIPAIKYQVPFVRNTATKQISQLSVFFLAWSVIGYIVGQWESPLRSLVPKKTLFS